MIQFTVHGDPVAKGRPRFNRYTGHAYTPEKTVNYENLVKLAFMQAYPDHVPFPKDTPLRVDILAYFRIPTSTSKKKRELMLSGEIRHTKKSDIDNVIKACTDSILGIAYEDDSSIVELHAHKYYSDAPRVIITIREAELPIPFEDE